MNRWQKQYQEFVQSESWKNICQFVGRSDYARIIDDSDRVFEAFRFKKMVNLISSFLEAIDLEVISSNTWNIINQQSNNVMSFIQNLDDPNHINNNYQQMNDQIDLIYAAIISYLISDKAAAQAVGQAFRCYREDVEYAIEEISKKREMTVSEFKEKINLAQNSLSEIEAMKNNIKKINDSLVGDEEGVEYKFNRIYDDLVSKKDAIEKFNSRLITDDEGKGSIVQQISMAKLSVDNSEKEIKDLLDSLRTPVDKLQEFYTKIAGTQDEQGNFTGGLNQEIDGRIKDISNFENEQKRQYEESVNRINSLLPGATSAGLASAYSDRKKNAAAQAKKYTKYFAVSIFTLMAIGAVIIYFSNQQMDWVTVSLNLVKYGPIFVPIIWLALFFSKRRSEAHRLEQEYAHKEALAKSYASFKHQIDELQEEDHRLLALLLHQTITAIAFNPSTTLDKNHGDKLPIQEFANEFVSSKRKN